MAQGGYTVPIYFLDTDLAENSGWDRSLTQTIYGGDEHYRISQEVILGMGTGMPPPTSFGTKCTKASMGCFGNILCNENFSGNAVVRFMIERII